MRTKNGKKSIRAAIILVAAAMFFTPGAATAGTAAIPGLKYIGAAKCKNCHDKKATGDQFGKWHESKHAKSFATLATPEALKAGKERGVEEPQKSPKCLKCHVTAYEAPAEKRGHSFDLKAGVQCESCHGAGLKHMKARLAAAADEDEEEDEGFGDDEEGAATGEAEEAVAEYQKLPEGEIAMVPDRKTCTRCHNDESPSYKGFECEKVLKEILHLDPRKKRQAETVIAERCKAQ